MNIKQLQERYKIASRSAFYSRLKALDLTLDKDSSGSAYATDAQIQLLDELDSHLKAGGNLKNFSPTSQVSVLSSQDTPNSTIVLDEPTIVRSSQDSVQSEPYNQLELLMDVGVAIAAKLQSPIQHWKELIFVVENNLILSTSEVQQLTGAKPTGEEWTRGSFRFVRSGKIGSQAGWKVEKVS